MTKKVRNPNGVTKSECLVISGGIKKNLDTITKALVGDDMRGGIVKDLADIKANLKNKHNGLGKKERVTVYSSALISAGLILSKVLEYFA